MKEKINLKHLDSYVEADTRFCKELHPNGKIIIYGYDGRKSNNNIIWNKFNKIMRGLIVDLEGNILVRPFNKFFTFRQYVTENEIVCSEGQNLTLPNEPYKILEKVDGSMGILYWDGDVPKIATQRSFNNPNAIKATEILHKKYKHTFKNLSKKYSYIFEIIYPDTNVLVDYWNEEKIVLLGVLELATGNELEVRADIGFPVAKNYTKEYSHIDNLADLKKLDIKNLEGFVLTYESGLKVKIKFPWYDKSHAIMNEVLMTEMLLYKKTKELKESLGIKVEPVKYKDLDTDLVSTILKGNHRKIPQAFFQNGFEQWLLNPNRTEEFVIEETYSKPEYCTYM